MNQPEAASVETGDRDAIVLKNEREHHINITHYFSSCHEKQLSRIKKTINMH